MDPEEKIIPEVEETPQPAEESLPVKESTEETATEAPVPYSKLKSRIKNYYPDRQLESDDDYDNTADEYFSKREEADNLINELFDRDPRIVNVLSDFKEGSDFMSAAVRHFGPYSPKEGDDNYEQWQNNVSEYEKGKSEKETSDAEFQKNIEATGQVLLAYQQEKGLDDEAMENYIKGLKEKIFDNYEKGIVTREVLQLFDNGSDYGNAVEQARVAGRNESIAAKKEKPATDGMPVLNGGGGEINEAPKVKTPKELGSDFINGMKKKY